MGLRHLILRTKPLRIAFNMLWCAVIFGPFGAVPRETISGFLGRRAWEAGSGSRWAKIANFIDWCHPHEPFHCRVTFMCERQMRAAWEDVMEEKYPCSR